MLTFEKIRDIERAERENKEMQQLPQNFIEELKEYTQLKSKTPDSNELKNARETIKRIFEAREKKLLDLALYSVKTGLPPENLTKEEESAFGRLVEILKEKRQVFFEELKKESGLHIEEKAAQQCKEFAFKVKKSLQPFVGPDLKIYELKENEIIDSMKLPKPLNDLLLKEGVLEQIEK